MKTREIEQKLNAAVSHCVPDVRDAILSACEQQKGTVLNMEQKRTNRGRKWMYSAAAVAAAAAMFVFGLFMGPRLLGGSTGPDAVSPGVDGQAGGAPLLDSVVAAVVAIDVNPSVELKINSSRVVLEANALNDDGAVILQEMNLVGTELKVAVNAVVGSLLSHGYIDELANSVLISVENTGEAQTADLEQQLVSEVSALLEDSSVQGAILSQTITKNAELSALAGQYGISEGKAALVQELLAQNPLLAFEDLATLSVHELNLLSNGHTLSHVSSTGSASDKAYIGQDKAAAAAFSHAGIPASDAQRLRVELDYEDGRMVYEVEFNCGGYEYEYDVDAQDGSIVKSEKERDDDQPSGGSAGGPTSSGSVENSGVPANVISAAKAQQAALGHAGLSADVVAGLKCSLDDDDGRWEYEVDFKYNGYEYEYDVDAVTGAILHSEKDLDD